MFRKKGGECIDPSAPNFDWEYWNFNVCWLEGNCIERKGRKCYCCGWLRKEKEETIASVGGVKPAILAEMLDKKVAGK